MINGKVESGYIRTAVWSLMGIYIFVFTLICALKFNSFGYDDFDLAHHAQTLWNILHGSLHCSILGIDFLGNHFHLILFFIVPLYALASHPLTLVILQTLCLGLAAYPLYLICRKELNSRFGLAFAAAYLLYPGLGYTNLFEFHPTALATFFLLWMFYFFIAGRFWWFAASMFFSLACQENISLLVTMVGIYALIRRRRLRWILVPVLAGGLWFYLAVFKLIPFFGGGIIEFRDVLYGHLGSSFGEIFKNIILHPFQILAFMFTPRKIIYLVQLLGPAAFLSIFDPASFLILIPPLAQHLLSRRATELNIYYHYTAEMIPFIFVSACFGTRRLYQFICSPRFKGESRWKETGFVSLILLTAVIFSIYLGPQLRIARFLSAYRKDYLDESKAEFLGRISKDTAVVATFQFLPRLTRRDGLYSFHHVTMGFHTFSQTPYSLPEEVNCALIDFDDRLTFSSFYGPDGGRRIREFLRSGNWGVREARGTVVFFEKNSADSFKLYEILNEPPPAMRATSASAEGKIELLGYELKTKIKREAKAIPLSFYWRRLAEAEGDYGVFICLVDRTRRVLGVVTLPLGYHIYPVREWKPSEIVKINFLYPVPPRLQERKYTLVLGVRDYKKRKLCKISTPHPGILSEDRRFIILGSIYLE